MSDAYHTPVLLEEVCAALRPALESNGGIEGGVSPSIYVDGTCGGGGHALEILRRSKPQRMILVDRDPEVLAHARPRLEAEKQEFQSLEFSHSPFSELPATLEKLGIDQVQGILLDLGVSSHQLDSAERGFSFRHTAPLDMRMDPSRGKSAAEWLEDTDYPELLRVLRDYGEETDASRIAKAILSTKPRDTRALAETVIYAMSARQRRALGTRIHPATRSFQALRIAVNEEFKQLDDWLEHAPELLAPGGRLAVISFHSLEDRRVKRCFRARSRAESIPRHLPMTAKELPRPDYQIPKGYNKALAPSASECQDNPRSRSARLRVLEKRRP